MDWQTFYKRIVRDNPDTTATTATKTAEATSDADSSDDEGGERGAENRQYIKELLLSHPIWKDGNYWEQTLWQCAIEQVR